MTAVYDRVYFSDTINVGATAMFWGANLAMLVVLQGLTGWTIGKLTTGLRVVGEDGRAPGLGQALLRWVLWVPHGFPYVLPLVGGLVALTAVGHRRAGARAAKPSSGR